MSKNMGDNSPIGVVDYLLLLLLVLILVKDSSCSSFDPTRKLAEFRHKIETTAAFAGTAEPTLAATASPPAGSATAAPPPTLAAAAAATQSVSNVFTGVKQFGRVFYPFGYGADLTGTVDSSDAIMNAINDAVQLHKGELLPGVADLGGIVIDLLGGNYIISKPLKLPPFIGNLVIRGGTIRASPSFPGYRHLIELWSTASLTKGSKNDSSINIDELARTKRSENDVGIYYEDITFRDILFDSSMRGGGIAIVDSARIRIHNCFFIHFTTQGVVVQGGHEMYISSSYFGQQVTIGRDKREKTFSGTAILLRSNDNFVTDVVIFSAGIGIEVAGEANMITGVHCYNKATYWGGIGILVRLSGISQNRISNCYMDYTGIVLEDPVQVHVTNTFFLGDANIVLKSVHGRISAVNIVDNMFCGGSTKPIVGLEGEFKDIDQVVVDRNNVNGKMTLKSTVGRRTLTHSGGSAARQWIADFSSILLFPGKIHHVQYALIVKGNPGVLHAVTDVSENTVTVSTNQGVESATVSVVVDQYNLEGEPVV